MKTYVLRARRQARVKCFAAEKDCVNLNCRRGRNDYAGGTRRCQRRTQLPFVTPTLAASGRLLRQLRQPRFFRDLIAINARRIGEHANHDPLDLLTSKLNAGEPAEEHRILPENLLR
jgi:hypothetical protein